MEILEANFILEMLTVLTRLCKENKVPLARFEGEKFPLSKKLMQILEDLIEEISWRRSRKIQLVQRIRKLIMDKSFSIRDTKLLSKMVNQQRRKGYIDYEELTYYFPGKTADMLSEHYNNREIGSPNKNLEKKSE